MRIFKPKYEQIWTASIEEYSSLPESEKDWGKIDLLSDSKIAVQYRELKKKTKISEELLNSLTDKYNAPGISKEDASEILAYMSQLIEVLKVQYFFLHSLQEIIHIRAVIC
jgi:alanine dehydrogenase